MNLAATAPSPAPLPATDSARPPWTEQFVGKTMAYYSDEFPHWDGLFTASTKVLGNEDGYGSLADARSAVAQLRPTLPPSDPKDAKTYPLAVAYLESDEGKFGAFELDAPMLSTKGFFRVKLISAPQYLSREDRVRAIDNFQGEVPCRGVNEGQIVV
jgi:hypothetical protein